MSGKNQGSSKFFKDTLPYGSICTKCSISYKTSSSPEGEIINSPRIGVVKELVCDCESLQTENPLSLNSPLNAKDIKANTRRPKQKKDLSKRNKIKTQIEKLRKEVGFLSLRASHCEGELRLKDRESEDLKEIVVGLRTVVEERVDRTEDSSCKCIVI